uniref:Protein-glutamine gamma-glutamyltransferase 2 n=1 Tax=Stegastes partitus TaxID=144197 RepID=A0A3B5AL81_9TELE
LLQGHQVELVDFHCQANNAAHRTIEISTKQLIVRRGQSFLLTLEMMRPFSSSDVLVLTVETGSAPSERFGTRSEFGNPSPMYASDVKAIWKYNIDRSAVLQRGIVTLSVTPPADAPVGKYSLSACAGKGNTNLGTLVVLFNPWCCDDWVYLPDERERQEYVMNEEGIIYHGSAHYITPLTWIFGQFEEDMVDICLKMLDVNPKHFRDPADDVSARCNPIYVGRVVSAMINSNDDRGVLVGCWGDNYYGGVSPTRWTGSVSILRHWYQNNCLPVKFGQCWVFAGVMCTVMRFLGIPCRVVTNFKSAHDTNNSLSIDEYYDDCGIQARETSDTIWNYHVWVEGWMKRPDLKKDNSYDGWQVLDPTPQEMSQGVYCCGPSPVAAILCGDTELKYDLPFVFAEVNADIVRWKRKMYSDSWTVGQNISTKAVGCNMRDDITNNYKHREGANANINVHVNRKSSTECQTLLLIFFGCINGQLQSFRELIESSAGQLDVKGRTEGQKLVVTDVLFLHQEATVINGQDIKLRLKLCNKDRTSRVMSIQVNAQAMRYNGKPAGNILNTVQQRTLLPGQGLQWFSFTKQVWSSRLDTVLGPAHVNREITLEVEFKNPLNKTLTDCSLTVIGCGFFRSDYVERSVLNITTIPYRVGLRSVVADFDCSSFRDVKGSCIVDVKP